MDHIMSPLGGHLTTAKLIKSSGSKMMEQFSWCCRRWNPYVWPRWSVEESSWHIWWWLISTTTELVSPSLTLPCEASEKSSQAMLHCWSCGDLLMQVFISWPCAQETPRLPRWAPSPLRGHLRGHLTLGIFPCGSEDREGSNESSQCVGPEIM